MPLSLLNRRTGQVLAGVVEIAETRKARNQGLLGRDAMEASAALVLTPCCSVHTAFMRFAIDVVFIDRNGRVVRIVNALPPWRAAWSIRAHSVIELAAGRLQADDLRAGDAVYLAPAEPDIERATASLASSSLRFTAAHLA